MLRVASLIRPMLPSQPAVSSACSCPLARITANSLRVQPTSLLWKPAVGVRSMMIETGQHRIVSPGVEATLRAQDKLPSEYSIIYRAPMHKYVKITYAASWISIFSVPLIVASIYFLGDNQAFPFEIGGIPMFEESKDVYILIGMLLLTTLNVAHTVSKYPYRIYRNVKEKKYVAVFQHVLPGLVKKKEFVAGDVKKAYSIFWKESCYAIKKKKMLIIPENFTKPIELDEMQIDPKLNDPAEIRKRRSRML